jgi:hypothetical protein
LVVGYQSHQYQQRRRQPQQQKQRGQKKGRQKYSCGSETKWLKEEKVEAAEVKSAHDFCLLYII